MIALRALLVRLGLYSSHSAVVTTPVVGPSLLDNEQTFFGPVLTRAAVVTVLPALLANTQALYGPTVTPGLATISAPLVRNVQVFPGADVSHPSAAVSVSQLTNRSTFYAPVLRLTVSVPRLVNAQAFFGPAIARGSAQTIIPGLLTGTQTFYLPSLGGQAIVLPPRLSSTQVFYGASVHGPIAAPLLVNAQSFKPLVVSLPPVGISAPLLGNSQALYAPTLNLNLSAQGIANAQAFYAPLVSRGSVQTIVPPVLESIQTFHGPSLGRGINAPLLTNTNSVMALTVTGMAVTTPRGIGRTPGYNAGTAADYIVAQDGTGTHTTITAALAAVGTVSNKTIRVKAGTYYEQLTLSASGLKIARYGTDEPAISGGLKITGWTACTSADAAAVGPNYTSIYKVRIGTSSIDHTAYNALLLTEAGEPLNIVTRRRDESDLFEQSDDGAFFRRDLGDDVTIGVDANGYATTVTHPSVLGVGTWTDMQLANATVMLLADPNVPAAIDVTSASGGVLTLDNPIIFDKVTNTNHPKYKPDLSPSMGAYALMNILPYMAQGQWGYINNNDGTLSLYLWPNSSANLSKIEVAARTTVITVTGPSVALDGLTVTSTSDTGVNTAPIYVYSASGCTIKECLVKNYSHAQKGYGGIYARSTVNFSMFNNEIANGQNQFGFFCNGGRSGINATRAHHNYIHRCSQTGPRVYGTVNVAVYRNLIENCGVAAHANKINFYEGCDQILVLANEWKNCGGYATIQESSRLLMLNCMCPSDNSSTAGGGRAFVDQTHSSDTAPTDPSDNYIINCAFPKVNGAYAATAAITVGQPYWSVNWSIWNTAAEGISATSTATTRLVAEDYNILTKGSAILGTHDTTSTQTALFADPTTDDFTALAPGSILDTKTGKDVTTTIAQFEAWFPDVNICQTINGDAWDPANPGVGPYGPGNWPT